MSKVIKKPKTELIDCAKALSKADLSTPEEKLEELIKEGYLHLGELKGGVHCNPLQEISLALRIDRVEELLERKRRLAALAPRRDYDTAS